MNARLLITCDTAFYAIIKLQMYRKETFSVLNSVVFIHISCGDEKNKGKFSRGPWIKTRAFQLEGSN